MTLRLKHILTILFFLVPTFKASAVYYQDIANIITKDVSLPSLIESIGKTPDAEDYSYKTGVKVVRLKYIMQGTPTSPVYDYNFYFTDGRLSSVHRYDAGTATDYEINITDLELKVAGNVSIESFCSNGKFYISPKSRYLANYYNYIQFEQGGDTTYSENFLDGLSFTTLDSTIRIAVVHEELSKDKIREIRRAKAAYGWAVAATIASSFSAGLNIGYSPAQILRYVNSVALAYSSATLAVYAAKNVNAAQQLEMRFVVENLSDQEIAIAEINRGLVWYIQPHKLKILQPANPDVSILRISNTDPYNQNVRFATIGAGSYVEKSFAVYEDSTQLVLERHEFVYDPGCNCDIDKLAGYTIRNQYTNQTIDIDPEQWKKLKSELKRENEPK